MVSKNFPVTHPKAGTPTGFPDKISNVFFWGKETKIHTIRANYELWEKRIKEIQEGRAYLSIRYWSVKPYQSKQVEIMSLNNAGIEKLEDPTNFVYAPIEGKHIDWEVVAKNDGLSFRDFCDWFKKRQNNPMAIIHFTDFRYAG